MAISPTSAVRGGVLEYNLSFGLGYRIYFGRARDRVVILLAGEKA